MELSGPLQRSELYALLKGYPSSLEVQYMIDQSLEKFSKKHKWGPPETSATTAPRGNAIGSSSTENKEWMETVIKAQVEQYLNTTLLSIVETEVEKRVEAQLRSAGISQTRQREKSPPPPLPRPPKAPLAQKETEVVREGTEPSAAPPAVEDGQRKRELILNAVRDIEHQLNILQKEVNEIAHQQRTSRRRIRRLCEAAEPRCHCILEEAAHHLPSQETLEQYTAKDTSPMSVERESKHGWKRLYDYLTYTLDEGAPENVQQLTSEVLHALVRSDEPRLPSPPTGGREREREEKDVSTQLFPHHTNAASTPPRLAQIREQSDQKGTASTHMDVAKNTAAPQPSSKEGKKISPSLHPTGPSTATPPGKVPHHPYSLSPRATAGSPRRSPQNEVKSHPDSTDGHFKLGIDAINVPTGALPRVLGPRGGVKVLSVVDGHSASKAGVLSGDVILSLSTLRQKEIRIQTCVDLQEALREVGVGEEVKIDVYRHSHHRLTSLRMKVE